MRAPPFPLAADRLSADRHPSHRPSVGIGAFTNRHAVDLDGTRAFSALSPLDGSRTIATTCLPRFLFSHYPRDTVNQGGVPAEHRGGRWQ